ncbi:MAG: biotin--[acetyl-CoA-carboxylase] ligase, partial [Pseudonocardiaceae bacterium]
VWVERRKLAGILVEGRPQEGWAVLGVGLNVATRSADFPDELRDIATSLAIESPRDEAHSRDVVLSALLVAIASRLGHAPEPILGEWRKRDALRGSRVVWTGGEGIAAGIDDSGALLVETGAGQVALDAGEVHLQRR